MEFVMDRAWREENARRTKQMDIWFLKDGRDKPDHPQAGLYTGLKQKYAPEQCKESQPTPST